MELGQIFTREEVADFMVSLLSVAPSSHFLDPCFGHGAFLKAARKAGMLNLTGYETDPAMFEEGRELFPEADLHCQDFLIAPTNERFNAVVVNPPYVRHEQIDNLTQAKHYKATLRSQPLYAQLPGNANLYMYFVAKCIDVLDDNGELVVILPGTWTSTPAGAHFLQLIESSCVIEEEHEMRGPTFESDVLVEVVVLKCRKSSVSSNPHPRKRTHATIHHGQVSVVERAPSPIPEHLDAIGLSSPFASIGSVERGITTGCNELFVNPPFESADAKKLCQPLLSSPKQTSGYSTRNALTDLLMCLHPENELPAEAAAYLNAWRLRIASEGRPRALASRLDEGGWHWATLKPKAPRSILFAYIVRDDMKFIYNELNVMTRDNFYNIEPCIDPFLALALLNNHYTYLQLESSGKRYGAGLLKLQKYDIDNLLFPNVSSWNASTLSTLANMGKSLVETGDAKLISKITDRIGHEIAWPAADASALYAATKSRRLGAQ